MKPTEAVRQAYARIAAETRQQIWISRVPEEKAMAQAIALEQHPEAASKPLYGLTFAVKDNIDVAGMPTTAACPAYSYTPTKNSAVVDALEAAGAILIGKTNMDQFATGLVGTRSPFGACSSIYNPEYISGGSSSGSAVAVALGQVDFSLGTDTAGSGRVPAAFNNIIGLKPTRGLISATGVVPACRTLDCVSIFTREPGLALQVLQAANVQDETDFLSRPLDANKGAGWSPANFRLGVVKPDQLEFFGDKDAELLYRKAVHRFTQMGVSLVEIDYTSFRDAANLLYSGPWVAERLAAIESFATTNEANMDPTVAKIILGARKYNAVDTYRSIYKLADLRRATQAQWARMDCLLLPTTGTTFTHAQIAEDPIGRNTQLGYYTNFVNLLDLSALAIPAGFRPNGLPFGVTLIAPAMAEQSLTATALRFLNLEPKAELPAGFLEVAVVGAHLTGMPLNHQLTSRGAFLRETTRTSPEYRFYALANTTPPKPGLEYTPGFLGPGIEVELWAIPKTEFGSFVAEIPPPLGIGTVKLIDGRNIKCFIAEPYALAAATDITKFGGWRAYMASR
ncbi:MAG: allophanate hydrolase [Acidobacteria bacterium]|nr:allophanate hydrolase [Acidobacteriota bacterium]